MAEALRLQRHLGELGLCSEPMRANARRHADLALAHAERAMDFPEDVRQLR